MALIKCPRCGKGFSDTLGNCPNCANIQSLERKNKHIKRKSKVVAGILCLFFWGFGAHELYLGNIAKAIIWIIVNIIVFFVAISHPIAALLFFVPVIYAITLWAMPSDKFDAKYNTSNSPKTKMGCLILIIIFMLLFLAGIIALIINLPQLSMSMMKEETAKALPILENVFSSQQRYYLKTGNYATTFDQLDVQFTDKAGHIVGSVSSFINPGVRITLKDDGYQPYVEAERILKNPSFVIRRYYNSNEIKCMDSVDSYPYISICKELKLRK